MMRILTVLCACALAGEAEAKLFQIYVQGQGGYSDGSGEEEAEPLFGPYVLPTRQDFYHLVHGPAVGAEAGLTLFGFDLNASFLQFMGDTSGTVTKVILGLRPTFDPGDDGDFTFFFRLGGGLMVATFGSDSPLAPELGKTPLGFAARGGLGVSYDLVGPLEIGPQVDVGYYRLLNGAVHPDPAEVDAISADIRAQCEMAADQAACVEQQTQAAVAANGGVGYETSSGIDWSAMFVLRAAFGL
jgi:hypothetical protein